MGELPNDGVEVQAVELFEGGMALTFHFPLEARRNLDRQHTIFVGYDQENFGAQAMEVRQLLEDLAFEVHHGYRTQPKEGA